MKKRGKTLALGMASLVILGGAYFGLGAYERNREAAKNASEEEEEKASILLSLAPAQIRTLSFAGGEGEVVLTQVEEGWRSPADEAFCGDESRIAGLLKDVAALKVNRTIEGVAEPAQYGLMPPLVTIRISTEKDAQEDEVLLLVGDRNNSTRETYVALSEEAETVYLTSTDLGRDFSGSLADYYAYEDFPALSAEKIREIKVEKSEGSYTLVTPGDDRAEVVDQEGRTEKGNLNLLGTVQNQLSNTDWLSHLTYGCEDYEAYGLGEGRVTLTICLEEPGTEEADQEVVLWVGDEDEKGNYYACLADSGEIHTLRKEYLAALVEGQASEFWSLAYSYVSIGDVDYLEVTAQEQTYVLRRVSDGGGQADENLTWFVDGHEVEKKPFTDFYYACVSVSAQERLTKVPKEEAAPLLTLHYYLTDGSEKVMAYYEKDQNFCTVHYEENTRAASVNRLYVKEMLTALEALVEAAGA